MSTSVLVEGMRDIKDHAKANSGQLKLPITADRKKYAFKWAKEGLEVEGAQQPQNIAGKYEVDGWVIWKHAGQMCKRTLSSGRYILLCRPRSLQNAINCAYGNESRERIIGEHEGKKRNAPEGEGLPGSGMLTEEQLSRLEPDPEGAQKLRLPFNKIKPAEASATTKNK